MEGGVDTGKTTIDTRKQEELLNKKFAELTQVSISEKSTPEQKKEARAQLMEIASQVDSLKQKEYESRMQHQTALVEGIKNDASLPKETKQNLLDSRDQGQQKLETKLATDKNEVKQESYVKQGSLSKTIKFTDTSNKLEFGPDGKMTQQAIINHLSDLTNNGITQVSNTGFFTKLFNKGVEQKYVVGEAQLQRALQNAGDLNSVYKNVTGDASGLDIRSSNLVTRDKDGTPLVGNEQRLDDETRAKIRKFQTAVVEKTEMVSALTRVLFNDPDQGAGLSMVLSGNTSKINDALLSPDGEKKLAQYIKQTETLDRKPGFGMKLMSALATIGINISANVASGGILGVSYESSDLHINKPKDGATGKGAEGNANKREQIVGSSAGNLKAEKQVGENGSVSANLDLAGLRFEANWNDPTSTLNSAMNVYAKANDKNAAVEQIIAELSKKQTGGYRESTKKENQARSQELTNQFRQIHQEFQKLYGDIQKKNPNDPKLKSIADAMEKEVFSYSAKMMELRGTKMQGVLANFGLSGLAAGVSFANVKNYASFDGAKTGAANWEAENNRRETTDDETKRLLAQAEITENADGSFSKNGEVVARPGQNEKVIWDIKEIIIDKQTTIDATARIVPKSSPEKTTKVRINLDNKNLDNKFIQANSNAIADRLKDWRLDTGKGKNEKQQKGIAIEFQEAASSGNIATAEAAAKKIFADMPDMIREIDGLKTDQEKKDFYKQLLSKSSGGDISRALGDRIRAKEGMDSKNAASENYETQKKAILDYYKKVGPAFAEQYGIPKDFVASQVEKMISTKNITTLRDSISSGASFTALVAFNQSNRGFKKLDNISNGNAVAFGTPLEVTGPNAETIRAKLKASITQEQRDQVRQQLAVQYGDVDANGKIDTAKIAGNPKYSDEAINSLITAGPIKSYLSFEENAECFNLGFMAETGMVDIVTKGVVNNEKSTYGQGTVVGKEVNKKNEFSGFAGLNKKDEPKKKEDNPPEKNEDPTPITKPEPDPVPVVPEQPVVKPVVPDVKPPVEVVKPPVPEVTIPTTTTNIGAGDVNIISKNAGSMATTTTEVVNKVSAPAIQEAAKGVTPTVAENIVDLDAGWN